MYLRVVNRPVEVCKISLHAFNARHLIMDFTTPDGSTVFWGGSWCSVASVSPLSERTLWRMLERCIFLSRTPALRYSLSSRSRNRRSSHTSSSMAAAQKKHTHVVVPLWVQTLETFITSVTIYTTATKNLWTAGDGARSDRLGTNQQIT